MSALTFAIILGSLCVAANAGYYGGDSCYWGNCDSCCYCCGSQYQPYSTYAPSYAQSFASSSSSSSVGWSSPSYGGGVYFDNINVDDTQAITNTETACQAFLEQYTDGIVQPNDLVKTIQKTFYGNDQLAKQNKNGLNPSTFHCCMEKFGSKIYKKPVQGKYLEAKLPKDVTCVSLMKDLLNNIKAPGGAKKGKAE